MTWRCAACWCAARDSDIGHILENVVYLELKRRYPEVYVGQYGTDGEVDLHRHPGTEYPSTIEVAQTTLDEQVLARELAPLRQIRDNYPKYLTMDEAFGEMNYEGIQKRNVLKWMLE